MGARSAVALGIAAYLVFLAATVPASFVAARLAAAAPGRVEITGATGSLWRGEAKGRIALPGAAPLAFERIEWRFLPARLAAGEAAAAIRGSAAGLSVTMQASRGGAGWTLRDLEAAGEARALAAFAPLLAAWQPGGTLALAAPLLGWDGRALSGEARLEWKGATTSLSEVRPLGSYRAILKASGGPAQFEVTTLEGALRLSGHGTLDPAGRIGFTGEARAEASQAKALEALLALLGPRRADGAHAIEWRSP